MTNFTTTDGGGVGTEAVSNSVFCSFKPNYFKPNSEVSFESKPCDCKYIV